MVNTDKPPAPMSWMQRLKRVIACIEDPPLIAKILGHVQRREALTSAPRGPPASQSLPNVT